MTATEPPTVAAAYDFSGFEDDRRRRRRHRQHARRPILARHPGPARRALRPAARRRATRRRCCKARGVADRVTIEAGSFFERVPAGGDAYLLSHIIHDWSEEQCLDDPRALPRRRCVPTAGCSSSRPSPEGDTPHQGKLQDLVMLLIPGGRNEASLSTRRCSQTRASGCSGWYRRRRSSASWKRCPPSGHRHHGRTPYGCARCRRSVGDGEIERRIQPRAAAAAEIDRRRFRLDRADKTRRSRFHVEHVTVTADAERLVAATDEERLLIHHAVRADGKRDAGKLPRNAALPGPLERARYQRARPPRFRASSANSVALTGLSDSTTESSCPFGAL